MKKIYAIICSLSISILGMSQNSNWGNSAGTSADDQVNSVAVDASGNTFIVGQMGVGSITFGSDVLVNTGGNPNGFVAKYNSSGTAQWGILLKNYMGGQVTSAATDNSGNLYITGEFTDSIELNPKGTSAFIQTMTAYQGAKNFYVAKYNTSGVIQWSNFMQSSGEWDARGIAVDASGNVYVTGSGYGNLVNNMATDSAVDMTFATEMPFVVKFNSSGVYDKVVILRTAADNLGAKAYGISLGADGNIVVCGSTEDTLTLAGSPKIPDLTNSKADIFVAKFNPQLNGIWGTLMGGEDEDEALAISIDDSSKIWVVGSMQNSFTVGTDNLTSNGGKDIFVAKVDSNGTPMGAFNIGGASNDLALGLVLDNNYAPWVTGVFSGSAVDFDPGSGTNNLNGGTNEEAFLANYSRQGGFQNAMSIGDGNTSSDRGHSLAFKGSSDLYCAGYFSSSNAEFNPNGTSLKFNNIGDRDAFVVNYNTVVCPVGNAGSMKGSGTICMGEEYTYSIDPVAGATTYTWTWVGDPQQILRGQGTNSITILVNNNQSTTLVVTPGNGTCTGSPANINLSVGAAPTWDNISTTNPTCGQNNGSISVAVNGTGPFNYLWSNGAIVSNPDSLTSGGYYVTVTDSVTTCKVDSLISLNDAGAPSISSNILSSPKCFGGNDGSIDLTITGGTAPIKFTWSNGDTTKTASGLEAGGHRVLITDSKGCSTSQIYFLKGNQELTIYANPQKTSTCGVNDGGVNAIVFGGVKPYKYAWSTSDTTSSLSSLAVGVYGLTVTDSLGCSDSVYADVNDNKGPSITLDSMKHADCQSSNGSIYISGSFSMNLSYAWSNGPITEDITGLSSGFYAVTATGGSCKGVKSFVVETKAPEVNPICLVTVDDSSKKNLCAFERGAKGTISKYLLYHESWTPGYFLQVGQLSVDSVSYWIDPLSDPQLKPWKYSIAVEDKCGAVSEKSPAHSTIHLVVEAGPLGTNNLRWSAYAGFRYDTVYIERFETGKGWSTIDSMPSTVTSFTDGNAPKNDKGLLYALAIEHPNGCLSTRANTKNFNSTRSNRSAPPSALVLNPNDTNKPKPSIIPQRIGGENSILVFPNPNQGMFNIEFDNSMINIEQLEILDLHGKVLIIQSVEETSQNNISIDMRNTPPGTYLIKIRSTEGNLYRRVIIN